MTNERLAEQLYNIAENAVREREARIRAGHSTVDSDAVLYDVYDACRKLARRLEDLPKRS